MRHCKHSSQTGYIYNDFIHVDLFENKLGHGDYIIQMPLYVRADQDAHILLSADRVDQAQQVKGSASVYEIGLYSAEILCPAEKYPIFLNFAFTRSLTREIALIC